MLNNEDLKLKLNELQHWFADNPKLPAQIDRQLLRRFLKCMSNDVPATKKLIELNYALRNKHTHIFIERDPNDVKTQISLDATDVVPLPGLTPEGHKLLFYRLVDYDPSKLNSVEECKIFFMTTDCRFTIPDVEPTSHDDNDDDTPLADGEVQVVDINGYSMSHIARISFMTLRIYLKFLQEAYPVRLRAMHVINCPSFLDKMVAVLKPFINDEVYNMIHFHTRGLDSLYEHVPRDMLPDEYGGKAGKVEDLKKNWRDILAEKRDYLKDTNQWKVENRGNQSRWFWF